MNKTSKDFDDAFSEKLKEMSPEERAKVMLKKLAQELEANKGSIKEPKGLASGAMDKDGKMIIELDEDYEDEQ